MGGISQPFFTNAVVRITTRLPPAALLNELQKIECRFGRVRKLRWGPRTLDLDILLYGDLVLECRELMVPHPGIPFRSFVLYPLREIAPHVDIPGMGTPDRLIKTHHRVPPRLLSTLENEYTRVQRDRQSPLPRGANRGPPGGPETPSPRATTHRVSRPLPSHKSILAPKLSR